MLPYEPVYRAKNSDFNEEKGKRAYVAALIILLCFCALLLVRVNWDAGLLLPEPFASVEAKAVEYVEVPSDCEPCSECPEPVIYNCSDIIEACNEGKQSTVEHERERCDRLIQQTADECNEFHWNATNMTIEKYEQIIEEWRKYYESESS